MIEFKLKANNCNRIQLFRPCWVGAVGLFRSDMLLNFLHGLAMIFLRDSLCLSAVYLSRQRHDILDFSYCPLPRVLHVILADWQEFGFEFHLRSSPSYSGYMDISLPAEYVIACYTVLMRPNKVETAVYGCNCWLSV